MVAAFVGLLALAPSNVLTPGVRVTDAEKCWALTDPAWRPQERWTWHQVCAGTEADLLQYSPRASSVTLRALFFVTILADSVYRNALPYGQIYIAHASFDEPIDLKDVTLTRGIRLDDCVFKSNLDLTRVTANGPLSLNRAEIGGTLSLRDLHGTSIYLMDVSAESIDATDLELTDHFRSQFRNAPLFLDLTRARIEGSVGVTGSLGMLQAHGAHFGSIFIKSMLLESVAGFEEAVIDQALTVQDSVLGSASRTRSDNETSACYAVNGALDVNNAKIGSVLLAHVVTTGYVNLNRSTVDGDVVVHDGKFGGACMRDTLVHGVFEVTRTKVAQAVDITSANIERNVYLETVSTPVLESSDVTLGGSFRLENSVVSRQIDFSLARVARGFYVSNVKGGAGFDVSNASIGGEFILEQAPGRQADRLGDVALSDTTLNDTLRIHNLQLDDLKIDNARIRASADVSDVQLSKTLNLAGTAIEGDLRLADTYANYIDLSSARVARTFFLTRTYGRVAGGLSLRDAVVQTIEDRGEDSCKLPGHDCPNPWPLVKELEGFHFSQLGSRSENKASVMSDRPTDWWKTWLNNGTHYVPEAYDGLATVLRSAGYDVNATQIALERRDQDRQHSPVPTNVLMQLWHFVVGYGYVIYYALIWALVFVVIGMLVLRISGEGERLSMPFGLTFSFDMLVPLILLEKEHESIRLKGWAKYYFYGHKIIGYILASFLVAGLSGLAK